MTGARVPRLAACITALILAIPGAFYVWTPVHWELKGLTPPGGDEPHYLIVADAIARDHRLSVGRAYGRDALERRIYGPIDWRNHSQTGAHGAFSVHNIGVPFLVAPLFAWFGIVGARLTFGLLAALIPFLCWRIARLRGLRRGESVTLAFCASFGLPFLLASGQIYPDLATGVVLLALVAVALQASAGRVTSGAAGCAGLLLAVLPWLHVKNIVPALVVGTLILLLQLRRERSWPSISWLAWLVAPLTVSLGLLAWYNAYAFGSLVGPYATGQPSAGATLRQAGMIFLGLHLDQVQGVFVQQPLFLLGLPGIVLLARRDPLLAAGLLGTYLGVVVPNSFHECWYGCFSLPGRFMWSVAALWFVPLIFFYADLGKPGRLLVGVAGLGTLAWQIALMARWYKEPSALYMAWIPWLWDRNSFFDADWRRVFPSFYDFGGYLSYTPNLVAVAVALSLLALGAVAAMRAGRIGQAGHPECAEGVRATGGEHRTAARILAAVTGAILLAGVGYYVERAREIRAVIDLVATFPNAQKRPLRTGKEGFDVRDERIAGEARRAIFAYPPSRIIWKVTVPGSAWLTTDVGIDEQAWQAAGDGVVFRIGVSGPRGYQDLKAQHVDPHARAEDRRWIRVSTDLGPYAGQPVEIIFNTYTSASAGQNDARNDLAYWGAPVIRRR